MIRWTNLTRRFGILFMALMLAVGIIGPQAVGASSGSNFPPITEPGVGQQPGICIVCLASGITSISEKTLFHASNFPNKASVEMDFTFVGQAASVSYAVQSAYAPNPPTPGSYWNLPIQNNGQYAAYQYLDVGSPYRFYAQVVDIHGNTYAKELTFWAA